MTKNYKTHIEKLKAPQKAQYDRIKLAQARLRNARETAEERARQMIRNELAELEEMRNAEVRDAHAKYETWRKNPQGEPIGLSTEDIKRAMGTKDHNTVVKIWSGIDLSLYQTPAEQPSFDIDYGAMIGTLHWIDWNGERIEGDLAFTIERDEEEFEGIRYWASYEAQAEPSGVMAVLDDKDAYMALARQVDTAVRAERGEK